MIPKHVHMTWPTKEIVNSQATLVKLGLRRLIDLNPDWTVTIHEDAEVNDYLEFHLGRNVWNVIRDDHIVTKTDLWRLIKLYEEGGVYCDIDRICDTPLDVAIPESVNWVLPTCLDHDFSHDFMATAPGNPAFELAAALYVDRRLSGNKNTYYLGPQTYMHAVTGTLTGTQINSGCGPWVMAKLREQIATMPFIATMREQPPYKTILHRGDTDINHEKEKRALYAEFGMKHWTGEW
jgi:mannosyltransferase OCH1-like enzyme